MFDMDKGILGQAREIAARSLRANYHRIGQDGSPEKTILTAGRRQYRSLWTRDFCFASGGALSLGDTEVVKHSLESVISLRTQDGLFPRLLDSMSPFRRVALAVLGIEKPIKHPLKPNFYSERRQVSMDSNTLVIWTALRYFQKTGDIPFLEAHYEALKHGLTFYTPWLRDGLISQPPYSDWQDVQRSRRGKVFFTNLLYWKAFASFGEIAQKLGNIAHALYWRDKARGVAEKIESCFWAQDLGYFRNTETSGQFSTDGNLLAILWDFTTPSRSESIFEAMGKIGIWTPWGPRCVLPDYRLVDKAPLSVICGLSGYTDRYVWLWQTALALMALHKVGEKKRFERLLQEVCRILVRDGEVGEIYHPQTGNQVKTWLYHSESPFSWSSGMLLEAFGCI